MKLKVLVVLFVASTAVVTAQQMQIVTRDVVGAPAVQGGMGPGGAPMKVGTGVIFGQVTEGETNRPVPGAIVSVNLPGSQMLRVMADGQGRFGFRDLPAGAFSVTATRPGWVDGGYGRTRPGGPTLALVLAEGERAGTATVPMWRYASISGTVVDEAGDPVVSKPVRVLKRVLNGGRPTLKVVQEDMTDDRGMYRVTQLEPGEYVVVVPMQQPSPEMEFAAMPGGGDMVFTRAVAVSGVRLGGDAVFIDSGVGGGAAAGIGPDGRPLVFSTMFYPNAPVANRAMTLTVASGEERPSVDFQLRAVATSKVSGIATGPDGPVPNLQMSMVPVEAGDGALPIETITGFTDGQGRFTIDGVPPGQYSLRAVRMPRGAMRGQMVEARIEQGGAVMVTRTATPASAPPLPTESTLWAEMTVAVGTKDLADVSVGLRPGVKMTGIVQFNGSAERPAPDRLSSSVSLTLEPADPRPEMSTAPGRVEASGQFATAGVPPGRYFVRVRAAVQGWTFQGAMVNGRDASVVPVDLDSTDLSGVTLVFTDRPTEVSGQVTSDGPVDAATVLLFPAETTAWVGYGSTSRRFANTRVDKTGKFKLTALPAGDYLAVAIPDKLANDFPDPKFLETLVAEATRVRVRDNEQVTTTLKVTR